MRRRKAKIKNVRFIWSSVSIMLIDAKEAVSVARPLSDDDDFSDYLYMNLLILILGVFSNG